MNGNSSRQEQQTEKLCTAYQGGEGDRSYLCYDPRLGDEHRHGIS